MPKRDTLHPHSPSSLVSSHTPPAATEDDALRKQGVALVQRLQASSGAGVRPQEVLALQRMVGNRAVQSLLTGPSAPHVPVVQRNKLNKNKKTKAELEREEKRKARRRKRAAKRLARTHMRNTESKAVPLEDRYLRKYQKRHSYGYDDTEIKARFVRGKFRRGFAQQPFLTVNKDDYDGSTVKSDYDTLVRTLQNDTTHSEARIAKDIIKFIENGKFDEDDYEGDTRRAIATLVQLTQLIESHSSRIPGSDKLARACFRRIAEGESTFHTEFNRENGNFAPARAKAGGSDYGGQDAGRDLFGIEPKKSDKAVDIMDDDVAETVDYMSESSDDESDNDD